MLIRYQNFKNETGWSDYGNTLPCSFKLSMILKVDNQFEFNNRINKRKR